MSRTRRLPGRLPRLPIVVAGTCLAAVACGGREPAAPDPPTVSPPAPSAPVVPQPALGEVEAEGTLAPPEQAQNTFTYDPAQAPAGAELSVEARGSDGTTQVRLDVDGLLPDRGYAAHAHARPCGPTGDAAGPHFQHEPPRPRPATPAPQAAGWPA